MERLTEYSCGVAVIKDKKFIQKAIYNSSTIMKIPN